jgi:hypothetical protein
MSYICPEFVSADILHKALPQHVTTVSFRDDMPEPAKLWSVESSGFMWCLPLRYSRLPVRRRLVRMMLTLQKYGEACTTHHGRGSDALTPAADYARSLIDTAMLRGELRCRPSGEMARYYLLQTDALLSFMAGVRQNKVQLRKEVRRLTAEFLSCYAAGAAS